MKQPCANDWCDSKVDRPGQTCGPCVRSAERTERLMARVEKAVAEQAIRHMQAQKTEVKA